MLCQTRAERLWIDDEWCNNAGTSNVTRGHVFSVSRTLVALTSGVLELVVAAFVADGEELNDD